LSESWTLKRISKNQECDQGFLNGSFGTLGEILETGIPGYYGLHYKDVDSTDYMKDDVFMEVELQYSLMASQLMEWLEELDVTSSESQTISMDVRLTVKILEIQKLN